MSPEAAKALLVVSVTTCLAVCGFAVRSAIDWYEGKSQGKIRFFLGIVGVIITLGISLLLYGIGYSVAEGSKEPDVPKDSGSEISPLPVEDVEESPERKRVYENGAYIGTIDEEAGVPDGEGIMYYNDGNIYDGSWKNGLPDGHGLMTYKSGDTYDGQWKNGKRDGYGTYIWQDGRKYIGYYKNGLRDGKGKFFGWNGFTEKYGWSGNYEGTSKEDYFDGEGYFIFDNEDQFKGVFRAGQFWDGIYTYSNGSQVQITGGVPAT